jgi:hypothetical protein
MPVPVLHHFNVIYDNKSLVFGGDSGAYNHQIGYSSNDRVPSTAVSEVWRLNLDSLVVQYVELHSLACTKRHALYAHTFKAPYNKYR